MKTLCSILTGLMVASSISPLAAITVTNLNDSGPGSLRAALEAGGNIDFAVTGTITLTSGELVVNHATTLTGPGAEQLTITRSGAEGTPAFRVLKVLASPVTISGLNLSNGLVAGADYNGAGILNNGTLTLSNCVVRGNRSTVSYARGTGLFNADGATLTANRCVFAENVGTGEYAEGSGIYVFGAVNLNDCTVRGNRGEGYYSRGGGLHVDYFGSAGVTRCTFSSNSVTGLNAQGGGIYNYGRLEIVNSTLSGNHSGETGGGIHIDSLAPNTVIRNCTISGNTARTGGAGLSNHGFSPNSNGPRTVKDSIIAGNSPGDIENGGVITSSGHNLFGLSAGNTIAAAAGDHFGVTAAALQLAPLANNGGPTQTRALLAGSPAIDAGNPTSFPATDQRGVARPFASRADIGAFELDVILPPVVTLVATQTNTTEMGPTILVAPGEFTISRSGSTNEPLQVFYRLSGTASNGVDYQFLSNSVVIPAGQRSAQLLILGFFDQLVEGTERVVLHLETLACPPIYPPPPGCYIVGAPAEAVVNIHDYNQPTNRPPTVQIFTPANNQWFTAGTDIFIAAQANDPDGYLTVQFVEFFAGTNSLGIRTNFPTLDPIGPFRLTWENVPPGEYKLTARAVDDQGVAATSEPVHVNVRPHQPPTNQPPTVHIVAPTNGQTFFASFECPACVTNDPPCLAPCFLVGPAVTICADARDADGYVDFVEFFAGTNRIGSKTNCLPCDSIQNPYCLEWANVPPGEYALTARVTDHQGATTTSAPVHVNVGIFQPPTVTIVTPTNGAVFTAPAVIQICADLRDTSGSVNLLEFFAGTNWLGRRTNCLPCASIQNPFCLYWTNPPPGEYALTVKAFGFPHGQLAVSEPVHISVRSEGTNTHSFRLAFNNPNANAGVFFRNYTLNGPVEGTRLLPADRVLAAGGDRYYYGAKPHVVWRVDRNTGAILELDPGAGLPELSWPMGVAYDRHRARVLLTSLGGDGYFYAYSPASNRWSLVRSQNNLDLDCLEYHPSLDAFFGVKVLFGGGGPGAIYRFNAEGVLQSEISLPTFPFGIGPTGYRSELVSVGDYLVLLLETDLQLDPYGESRMYLIDPRNGEVQLTYRHVRPRPNLPPSVQINSPVTGQLFHAPAEIQLVAYAQDPEDGYAVTVEFFAGDHSLGFGTFVPTRCAAPYCPNFALTWSNVPPGQYRLQAAVTDSNGTTTVSAPVEITVFDAALSLVTIRATDAGASEAGDLGRFTVLREGNTNSALHVFYSIGGTASNGLDYVALSNSVFLPEGVQAATIEIKPVDDSLFEGTERVELRLLPPPFYLFPYLVGSPSSAVVNIADNDEPQPKPVVTIEATDAQASETPGNPGQFRIHRSGSTNQTLQLYLAISGTASNGVDYARLTNLIILPAGRSAAELVVTPINDNLFEGAETVVAALYYPPIAGPGAFAYVIGSPSNAIVTITDNDEPPPLPVVTIQATDPTASETPGNPGQFRVQRTGPTNQSLHVHWTISGSASNGVDYARLTNLVVIPAGKTVVEFLVMPVNDNLVEGNETVVATLHHPLIAIPPTYTIGFPNNAIVSIADNDSLEFPVVSIEAPHPTASETPGNPGLFHINRTGPTNNSLTVFWRLGGTASNGVDYMSLTNPVVIPAGHSFVRVAVVPIDDQLVESNETVSASLFFPLIEVAFPYTIGAPSNAVVTILDNDPIGPPPFVPAVVTIEATDPQARETGLLTVVEPGMFTIRRTGNTNVTLDVQCVIEGTASNGVDYISLSNIVIIPSGVTSVPVPVYPINDNHSEGTETVTLHLQTPYCIAIYPPPPECYQVGVPDSATVFISDPATPGDPLPVVSIIARDAVAAEGTNCVRWIGWANTPPATNFCGTNMATFVVRREGNTNESLAVAYEISGTAANGVDYLPLPGVVTIPAGRRVAEINIVPVDDALREHTETTRLTLRAAPSAADAHDALLTYTIGRPARAGAILVDNEQPRPGTGTLSDRSFHLMRPGNNGSWFRIETSTNLIHWTALCTNVVTDGAIHFVDPEAEDSPARFYRAVPETNPPTE